MLRGFENGKSFKLHVLILLSYCSVEKYLQRFRRNDLKLLRASGVEAARKTLDFSLHATSPSIKRGT